MVAWLEAVIAWRMTAYFEDKTPENRPAMPGLKRGASDFARALLENRLDADDCLVLMLALAADLAPQSLDPFLIRNPGMDRGFSEFGGVQAGTGGFRPTVDTALFLLAGSDIAARLAAIARLSDDAPLVAQGMVSLQPGVLSEIRAQPLVIEPAFVSQWTTGRPHRPGFRGDFPAHRLETPLDWDDLILAPRILHQIGEIIAWIDMGEDIRANPAFGRVLQPGFRSLFYGPPGTGKTLTASLIGKKTGHDVYRVDLSMIVSKWIGETEKNLANVFDRAEGNGWILFFDEADAIFGKRSDVNQANDRYANQEVSYLLQRVEQFDGVVLLASNLRGNIDPAFGRRFQSMIHFALPNAAERLRLWTSIFSDPALIGADVDFAQLAEAHELTGGAIVNVLRAAILSARRGGHAKMSRKDIDAGIRRELNKDGRVSGGKR